MQVITTHTGTDFDALASMVACTFLYPGSVGLLPSMVNPEVKQFLGIHADILRIQPRKGFDLDEVTSLVVVDANSWKRLEKMEPLSEKEGLEIICWDHHMQGVTIESGETHREEVGAAVTLLLEEMKERDIPFTPMHATLFLLGIYSDTGCLTFPSVTARDATMVGFLLENGADLNVVSAYLDEVVDDAHGEVFGRILDESETVCIGSTKVGISAMEIQSGLTSLAPLMTKYREFKGLDAAFGIFQADSNKCMVIGRGNPKRVDVGQIMRALGGGGHPGAGSAIIRKATPDAVAAHVRCLLDDGCQKGTPVKDVMSAPNRFIVQADVTMAQAAEQIADENGINGMLVCDGDKLIGGLSGESCSKAEKSGRSDVPVKGYAKQNIPRLAPTDSCRDAIEYMADSKEGILAVVEDNVVTGVVTQVDLMLQVYEF